MPVGWSIKPDPTGSGVSNRSNRVTLCPARERNNAEAKPPMPAPQMATANRLATAQAIEAYGCRRSYSAEIANGSFASCCSVNRVGGFGSL